jgi:putative hydrolase of HD superfamily
MPKKTKTSQPQNKNFQKIFDFLQLANDLKFVLRYNHKDVVSDKKDMTASHTWRMALMAMVFSKQMRRRFNLERALKICLVHDLPEAVAGDVTYRDTLDGKISPKEKIRREKAGMKKLTKGLSRDLAQEILGLWQEYGENRTAEAKFVKVLDKVEAAFHGLYMTGNAWKKAPDPAVVHTNSVCGILPEMDPLLRFTKRLLKKECAKAGIPWKKEYDGFSTPTP